MRPGQTRSGQAYLLEQCLGLMSKREGTVNDKDVSFFGWEKRRWVFLFLLLSFSLYLIFLSGFGVGILVLD